MSMKSSTTGTSPTATSLTEDDSEIRVFKKKKSPKRMVPWKKKNKSNGTVASAGKMEDQRDDAPLPRSGETNNDISVKRRERRREVDPSRPSLKGEEEDSSTLHRELASGADRLFRNGDYDGALLLYKKAIRKAFKDGDYVVTADALIRFANIQEGKGKVNIALIAQEKALKIYDLKTKGRKGATPGSEDVHSYAVIAADTLGGIGNSMLQLGDMEGAKECYQEALLEVQGLNSAASTETAINLHKNMSKLLSLMGDHKGAIGAHTEALKLQRDLYGEKHTSFAETLNELGGVFLEAGKKDKAIDSFKEALMICRVNDLSNDHPLISSIIHNLYRAQPPRHINGSQPKSRSQAGPVEKFLGGVLNLECNDWNSQDDESDSFM